MVKARRRRIDAIRDRVFDTTRNNVDIMFRTRNNKFKNKLNRGTNNYNKYEHRKQHNRPNTIRGGR